MFGEQNLVNCVSLPERPFQRTKAAVVRGINDQGVLVKHSGTHSTYGSVNTPVVNVDKTSAANPAPQTQQKIKDQTQLRIDLQRETPGSSFSLNDPDKC